jgi:hypothetical protein
VGGGKGSATQGEYDGQSRDGDGGSACGD